MMNRWWHSDDRTKQFAKNVWNFQTNVWAMHAGSVKVAHKNMVTMEWIGVHSGGTYSSEPFFTWQGDDYLTKHVLWWRNPFNKFLLMSPLPQSCLFPHSCCSSANLFRFFNNSITPLFFGVFFFSIIFCQDWFPGWSGNQMCWQNLRVMEYGT